MNEASFTGFFRTLLTIIVVWWVVRFLVKAYIVWNATQKSRSTFHQTKPDPRVKGEVRIERLDKNDPRSPGYQGPVEDADYEEVK